MNIIIIGGGKIGYYLVKTLLEHDHDPILIEINKKYCKFLANDLDIPVICGDGTSIEVLESAYSDDIDAFVSVTGQDETNLISCQLAKKLFNTKKTIAKVNNPRNSIIMKQLGIDIVLSSTDNIARLLEREIQSSDIKELLSINNGSAAISEINIPKDYKLSHKTLSEIDFPNEFIVISILRGDEIIIPRGNVQILPLDKIMVMSKNKNLKYIKQKLKLD
ncbi:MAG: NAD-binding protein [Oscillospiraceae bacterium]|nr:NAD-binding protein [Oscillospiraceae bacterium]